MINIPYEYKIFILFMITTMSCILSGFSFGAILYNDDVSMAIASVGFLFVAWIASRTMFRLIEEHYSDEDERWEFAHKEWNE